MFRRKPKYAELERLDEARQIVHKHDKDSAALEVFDAIKESLLDAISRKLALRELLLAVDAGEVGDELKSALRSRPSSTDPDTKRVALLRRKFETTNDVVNQFEKTIAQIEHVLIEAETFAAETVAAGILEPGDIHTLLAERLEQMRVDAELLSSAHRELADL